MRTLEYTSFAVTALCAFSHAASPLYELKATFPCQTTLTEQTSEIWIGDEPNISKDQGISLCQERCDNKYANCAQAQWYSQIYNVWPDGKTTSHNCLLSSKPFDQADVTCDPAKLIGAARNITDVSLYSRNPPANIPPKEYTKPCDGTPSLLDNGDFENGIEPWDFRAISRRPRLPVLDANGTAKWSLAKCNSKFLGDCASGISFFKIESTETAGPLMIGDFHSIRDKQIEGWRYKVSAQVRGANSTWGITYPVHTSYQLRHQNTREWQTIEVLVDGVGTVGLVCEGESPARCDIDNIKILKMC